MEIDPDVSCLRCEKKNCFNYISWESQFKTENGAPIGIRGRICNNCGHVEFFGEQS